MGRENALLIEGPINQQIVVICQWRCEMMKKWFTVIGVLCLVVTLVACSTSLAGSQATVELEGNPTTGFSWEVEIANPDIVKEVASDYISDQQDEDVVGVGGVFSFTFKGITEGETELTFVYRQSWDEETPPAETVTYIATVDSNLVVTLTQK